MPPFRPPKNLPRWCWVRLVREPGTDVQPAERIRGPADVHRLLAPRLHLLEVEAFCVLSLGSQSQLRAIEEVTRGILNSSLIHPREVFRSAILAGAAGIIVAHNHPSADPTPSADDRAVTRQLVDAGRLLDIPVYDHVILAGDGTCRSPKRGCCEQTQTTVAEPVGSPEAADVATDNATHGSGEDRARLRQRSERALRGVEHHPRVRENRMTTTETKPKAAKREKKEKAEKPMKPWSPAAQQAATSIVTLWTAIVNVQALRGQAKAGDGKLAESLDRSTVYLKRSAKLLAEAVE